MVTINDSQHVVNDILNVSTRANTTASMKLIKRDEKKDEFYFSKQVELDSSLVTFIKDHIADELIKLKLDSGDENIFRVGSYNNELQLNDVLGVYNYNPDDQQDIVSQRIKLLEESMTRDSLDIIKDVNFQLVTLEYENKKMTFCFYRGVKKFSKKKRWAFMNSNEFQEVVENNLVEIGGPISFFYDDNSLYIIRVRDFENAFVYKDHISSKSNENLDSIVSMDFFADTNSKDFFVQKSKNTIFSRGLAQISQETMTNIQVHFDDRLNEMLEIKNKIDSFSKEQERLEFEKEIGDLKDLLVFFDFAQKKICFTEDQNPKPLLHFFQDKIVTSFLTKRVKTMMA